MTSRDAILHRIRTRLSGGPTLSPPPVPEVWPRENPDRRTMAARFAEELTAIFGEVIRCDSMAAAQKSLAELVETAGWASLGALDLPIAREAVAGLAPERVRWVDAAWTRHDIAQLPAGLIAADALLADTGTCAIACEAAHERLMCYLPPACVVVARGEQLVEHLPAAWAEIVRRSADPAARGELVLVTGPSRTADIEKILILGVHGPKRLVVLLVD
jgi:L-lactate dehydrogenase complex protein LldG